LRLNDWVPVVRYASLEICQNVLMRFHPIELIKNFTLIEWLGETRDPLIKHFQQKLFLFISQDNSREEVFIYLRPLH